jgi:hypothetical protein
MRMMVCLQINNQILAELMQAGSETLQSEICKHVNSI